MVTISILVLPHTAGASTTYSNYYGTIHYDAYTGDSQSKIKAELEVNTNSKLQFIMYPTVCIYQNNSWVTFDGCSVFKSASLTKKISKYYYYTNYATEYSLPNTG